MDLLDEICEKSAPKSALYKFDQDLVHASSREDDPKNALWLPTAKYDSMWDDLGIKCAGAGAPAGWTGGGRKPCGGCDPASSMGSFGGTTLVYFCSRKPHVVCHCPLHTQ